MNIIIIKYNAGNTQSVQFALDRIGFRGILTDDPELITNADKIIFPGVGEASSAMNYLREKKLDEVIRNLKQPVLGICLGMQLLCNYSEENETECLGIFDSRVKLFPPSPQGESPGMRYKVPHIGWNEVREKQDRYYAYFVHSYYAALCEDTTARTEYGISFSACLRKNNFYGSQFHPEKSGLAGERILKQFLSL